MSVGRAGTASSITIDKFVVRFTDIKQDRLGFNSNNVQEASDHFQRVNSGWVSQLNPVQDFILFFRDKSKNNQVSAILSLKSQAITQRFSEGYTSVLCSIAKVESHALYDIFRQVQQILAGIFAGQGQVI